jgi:hypothetical protein
VADKDAVVEETRVVEQSEEELEILAELRARYQVVDMSEADNRNWAVDDLRFLYEPNGQWTQMELNRRAGRPTYTFNRCLPALNQVIGDQRQVSPDIKIRAVDAAASQATAEVYSGLIRNIQDQSDAKTAYDNAFKYAVGCGYGYWIVVPEYCDAESFNQDIFVKMVANPFTVFIDQQAVEPTGRDANWAIVAERISKDEFKSQYPGRIPHSIQISRDTLGWITSEGVRIADYWRRGWDITEIAELDDGTVVPYDKGTRKILREDAADRKIVRTREVRNPYIEWCKADGYQILEGPIKYPWKYIPVVRCAGRYVNIEGRRRFLSIHRTAKDAQRSYNYNRSAMVERVALVPRAPYLVTPKMIKGYESVWATANTRNTPYLPYNVDPEASATGGAPKRETPPDVPSAAIALATLDAQDIEATTGYHKSSLGNDQQDASGTAIENRQREGDVGSFEFIDNFGKALRYTAEILIDMIPKIYDTEREIRILGPDGAEDFKRINAAGHPDLSKGRYDVAVALGPSYTTQRQESLDTLLDLLAKMPALGQIAPDLIVKNLDVQGAQELERRIRWPLVQQGVIEPNDEEKQKLAQRQPDQPDPLVAATVKDLEAKAEKTHAEAMGAHIENMNTVVAQKSTALKLQKLIEEITGDHLDNLLKARELGHAAPLVSDHLDNALKAKTLGAPTHEAAHLDNALKVKELRAPPDQPVT